MGPFRVCCLAVWFDLSGFNFGPFFLVSLELLLVNYMMILFRLGDAVGGGAIYELMVSLKGSMAFGCWWAPFGICIYVGCCYVRGFGCIMLLATIFIGDLYLSFL
ncbi:hypothetical protein AMTRI_Chr05g60230 [Amborella trichopoda]